MNIIQQLDRSIKCGALCPIYAHNTSYHNKCRVNVRGLNHNIGNSTMRQHLHRHTIWDNVYAQTSLEWFGSITSYGLRLRIIAFS